MKVVLGLLLVAQSIDPVPDRIKMQIIIAHRDQLQAEAAKREAMIAFHVAESRYESAKHRMDEAKPIADASCAPKRFDVDSMECK